MDNDVADELLTELFSAFENAETQSAAILQFLKDKGMATDEELAPYLEQAGNASSVRWRATRVRISSLLASAAKKTEELLVHKAEDAAQKTVAAERENEKSTRRRHKDRKEKEREDQVDKSANESKEERAANSHDPKDETEPEDSRELITLENETPKASRLGSSQNVEDGDNKQKMERMQQRDREEQEGREKETGKKIA
jgi:hypothetical protein